MKKEAKKRKLGFGNIRRDGNEDLKKLEKAGGITEDDLRGYSEDIQKITDQNISKIDDITKDKEKEILEV